MKYFEICLNVFYDFPHLCFYTKNTNKKSLKTYDLLISKNKKYNIIQWKIYTLLFSFILFLNV